MSEAVDIAPLLRPDESAVIVFLRPQQFAATTGATTVFDITHGVEMIGIFTNGMKVVHVTSPGERFFMGILAGRRTVMHAQLEAGRIYYAKVFVEQVHPLRPATQEQKIREYWHESVLVSPNDRAERWLAENLPSVEKHRRRGLERWPKLSARKKERFELRAEDGVAEPIR